METIRYYEQQGLLEKSARSDSNYRSFGADAEKRLRFVVQCRFLDMSMKDIERLLSLVDTPEANCGDVDDMLDEHIAKVREQRRNLAKQKKRFWRCVPIAIRPCRSKDAASFAIRL